MAKRRSGKPWAREGNELPGYVLDSLYQVSHFLGKATRKRVGLMMEVPVFIKDPSVARDNPLFGVQEIEVRLEVGMGDGPTSSRIAVVDFNGDTQTLTDPVVWDADAGWFREPAQPGADGEAPAPGKFLPDPPPKTSRKEKPYRDFIDSTLGSPWSRQVNVWAVVQRVLEFYEEPWALGRPIPWGFDGNRLIVVPHAGYGENAFYDQHSKSLQFYYFGDQQTPGYTCLSFDIIAHETGHAILDGIRPRYNQLSSVQTAAFHEFIGDLTAITLSLFNKDIRHFVGETMAGRLEEADILANIAPEFGKEVEGRPYLRTAFNKLTMADVQGSLSPHKVSEVLTGAMYEILIGTATRQLERNFPENGEAAGEEEEGAAAAPARTLTPAQVLWRAADGFRRIALQPLDLCPPCDIQFLDYAKAVIRNDILTNPVDALGYRRVMLDVFHRRGLCSCGYESGAELPPDCAFVEAHQTHRIDFVFHDIDRLSRSRTAAYYFLSDNRRLLHIPAHQDVQVVDLYDNGKYGVAAERLPREVVLEYVWQEEVPLVSDEAQGLAFGAWEGKTYPLDCGGTLVFDGRGNLLSWFRKPGTEHLSADAEAEILRRLAAFESDPPDDKKRPKKPTRLEMESLADLAIGRQRKRDLLKYLSGLIRRGLVGEAQPESGFSEGLKPVVAREEGGVLLFETTPHLRKSDFDAEAAGWTMNF